MVVQSAHPCHYVGKGDERPPLAARPRFPLMPKVPSGAAFSGPGRLRFDIGLDPRRTSAALASPGAGRFPDHASVIVASPRPKLRRSSEGHRADRAAREPHERQGGHGSVPRVPHVDAPRDLETPGAGPPTRAVPAWRWSESSFMILRREELLLQASHP